MALVAAGLRAAVVLVTLAVAGLAERAGLVAFAGLAALVAVVLAAAGFAERAGLAAFAGLAAGADFLVAVGVFLAGVVFAIVLWLLKARRSIRTVRPSVERRVREGPHSTRITFASIDSHTLVRESLRWDTSFVVVVSDRSFGRPWYA